MTPRQKRRLLTLGILITGIALTAVLTFTAFQQNMLFFLTPTQVHNGEAIVERPFRLGGMVEKNSIIRGNNLEIRFTITDFSHSVDVTFSGILPDLFREEQGVIVKGRLDENGLMNAREVLAKHDENYMPPEVKDAIDKSKMNDTLQQ